MNAPELKALPRRLKLVCWAGAIAFFVFLIVHLFVLIDRYSVNLIFWDNFDYYFTLAGNLNFWQRFTAQISPHREGFGLLLSSVIAPLSHWNMRAEAFAIGVILTMGMIACLCLKSRAFGPLTFVDLLVVPAIFLSPLQFELWSRTVNSSHGALPLLFIMIYCLAWTVRSPRWRDGLLLCVTFFAIFTGFGFFLGIVALITFLVRRNITASIITLGMILLFFVGHHLDPANPNFHTFDKRILAFPISLAFGFAAACGFRTLPLSLDIGFVILLSMIGALAANVRGFVRGETKGVIVTSLISFSLIFMLATIEGRISFGLDCLAHSRYIPLISPALVGVYFSLAQMRTGWVKTAGLVAAVSIALFVSIKVNQEDLSFMEQNKTAKLLWIQTYLSTHDIDTADQVAKTPIYPHPRPDFVVKDIEYLRANRLNFFYGAPNGAGKDSTNP